MADVNVSTVCSNFDPAAGGCRLNGSPCPHSTGGGDFAACPDATFLARVSMPPDEFVVVLNAAGEPTLGTLTVIRCRRPEFHHAAAGVHVNAVLESPGDGMLLETTWRMDGAVEYWCPATDVRVLWRSGKFIPI
jgi:hypothetical protein